MTGLSRALALIMSIAACLVFAGCAATPTATTDATPVAPAEYRINPGDKIDFSVYDEDQMKGTFVVAEDGKVSLPLIGALPAAGMTINEFVTSVQTELGRKLVNQPRVNAQIVGYRPFYVLGEVEKPGAYDYQLDLTVYAAIATAGGFTYRARTGTVYIRSAGSTEERAVKVTPSTQIAPGDTVRVASRIF